MKQNNDCIFKTPPWQTDRAEWERYCDQVYANVKDKHPDLDYDQIYPLYIQEVERIIADYGVK